MRGSEEYKSEEEKLREWKGVLYSTLDLINACGTTNCKKHLVVQMSLVTVDGGTTTETNHTCLIHLCKKCSSIRVPAAEKYNGEPSREQTFHEWQRISNSTLELINATRTTKCREKIQRTLDVHVNMSTMTEKKEKTRPKLHTFPVHLSKRRWCDTISAAEYTTSTHSDGN